MRNRELSYLPNKEKKLIIEGESWIKLKKEHQFFEDAKKYLVMEDAPIAIDQMAGLLKKIRKFKDKNFKGKARPLIAEGMILVKDDDGQKDAVLTSHSYLNTLQKDIQRIQRVVYDSSSLNQDQKNKLAKKCRKMLENVELELEDYSNDLATGSSESFRQKVNNLGKIENKEDSKAEIKVDLNENKEEKKDESGVNEESVKEDATDNKEVVIKNGEKVEEENKLNQEEEELKELLEEDLFSNDKERKFKGEEQRKEVLNLLKKIIDKNESSEVSKDKISKLFSSRMVAWQGDLVKSLVDEVYLSIEGDDFESKVDSSDEKKQGAARKLKDVLEDLSADSILTKKDSENRKAKEISEVIEGLNKLLETLNGISKEKISEEVKNEIRTNVAIYFDKFLSEKGSKLNEAVEDLFSRLIEVSSEANLIVFEAVKSYEDKFHKKTSHDEYESSASAIAPEVPKITFKPDLTEIGKSERVDESRTEKKEGEEVVGEFGQGQEDQIKEIRQTSEKYQKIIDLKETTILNLKNKIEEGASKISEKNKELEDLRRNLKEVGVKKQNNENETDKINEEIEILKRDLEKSKLDFDELKQKQILLVGRNNYLEAQAFELQRNLDDKEKIIEKNKTEKEGLEINIENLKEKIKELEVKKDNLENENNEDNVDSDEVEKINQQIEDLKDELKEKNQKIQELESNIVELNIEMGELREDIDSANNELEVLYKENEELNEQIKEKEDENNRLDQEIEKLKKTNEDLVESNKDLQSKVDNLKDEFKNKESELNRTISDLREKNERLLIEIEENKNIIKTLRKELRLGQEKLEGLTQEAKMYTDEVIKKREFKNKAKKLENEVRELKKKLEGLGDLKKQNNEASEFFKLKEVELNKIIEELQKENGILSGNLKKSEKDGLEFLNEIDLKEKKIEGLKNETEQIKDDLEKQIEELNSQIELDGKKVKSLEEKNDGLIKTIKELRKEIDNSNTKQKQEIEKARDDYEARLKALSSMEIGDSGFEALIVKTTKLLEDLNKKQEVLNEEIKKNEILEKELESYREERRAQEEKHKKYKDRIISCGTWNELKTVLREIGTFKFGIRKEDYTYDEIEKEFLDYYKYFGEFKRIYKKDDLYIEEIKEACERIGSDVINNSLHTDYKLRRSALENKLEDKNNKEVYKYNPNKDLLIGRDLNVYLNTISFFKKNEVLFKYYKENGKTSELRDLLNEFEKKQAKLKKLSEKMIFNIRNSSVYNEEEKEDLILEIGERDNKDVRKIENLINRYKNI